MAKLWDHTIFELSLNINYATEVPIGRKRLLFKFIVHSLAPQGKSNRKTVFQEPVAASVSYNTSDVDDVPNQQLFQNIQIFKPIFLKK